MSKAVSEIRWGSSNRLSIASLSGSYAITQQLVVACRQFNSLDWKLKGPGIDLNQRKPAMKRLCDTAEANLCKRVKSETYGDRAEYRKLGTLGIGFKTTEESPKLRVADRT
ncbi:hypothetical protein EDB19DRAFT_1827348 [Suillus lakei]|nr:hypothetical protein EDB19DRAFT_1827348 [Suillus lakei]